jgi:hypothetical protein
MMNTDWIPREEMRKDIYTKILPGSLSEKHRSKFVGKDQYMKIKNE